MEWEDEPDMGLVGGASSWDRCIRDLVGEVLFIIYDSSREKILVGQVDGYDKLPGWFYENTCYRDLTQMKQAIVDLFSPQCICTVLRCVWLNERECHRENCLYTLKRSIVTLEFHQGLDQLATSFQWVSITEVSICHSEEDTGLTIERELGYVKNNLLPQFRVPWTQFGWYENTSNWLRDKLSEHGFVVTEPIGQLRVSPWGTVLRTTADSKLFYLKESLCFCNEAAINNVLSSVAPLHAQKPLIVDTARRINVAADRGESVNLSELSDDDTVQPVH